jgi:beta-N-acetylhexosaminidase
MRDRIGTIMLWTTGLGALFLGLELNDPYLALVRDWLGVVLVVLSGAAIAVLLRGGFCATRGIAGKLLVLLWCATPLAMVVTQTAFHVRMYMVLHASGAGANDLGQHFIVGYTQFDEIAALAAKGRIGGIYVTRHNIAGRTADDLRSEIARLQDMRRAAGLAPLIVATDQEGGIVSHLSPQLTALPSLSTLAGLPPAEGEKAAEEFGRTHGRELAALGVTLNLAPVVDLRRPRPPNPLDFNSLIDRRAIAADPALVETIALAYIRGLAAFDVRATVKHFPGLGRVGDDTHHFRARLDTPVEELEATDWRPFRAILSKSAAYLMVGHVNLTALDPDRPASHSKRVIDGLLRQAWGYQGLIITDDMVMSAVYQHGICTAVVEALNAGVDLLLVAFDGEQYFAMFDCALAAFSQGRIDQAMLAKSRDRLQLLR